MLFRIIPVLFTCGNPLTPAQVDLINAATHFLRQKLPQVEISQGFISLISDTYLQKIKRYPNLMLQNTTHQRLCITGEERMRLANAVVCDYQTQFPHSLPIHVSSYELENACIPGGNNKRGYIHHCEMLSHLQKDEIRRAALEGDQPALFVLVGGADFANKMRNWSSEPGMPFLIATRKNNTNPSGKLTHNSNFKTPVAYLNQLKYKGDLQPYSSFQSSFFDWEGSPYSWLSSTLIAECHPEALGLFGPQAFQTLVDILCRIATEIPHDHWKSQQRLTATATLNEYQQLLKKNTLLDKQTIIEAIPGLSISHSYQRFNQHTTHYFFPGTEKNEADFDTICNACKTPLEKAKALLNDYSKNDSAWQRCLSGSWKRTHLNAVTNIVELIGEDLEVNTIPALITKLSEIELKNEKGTLAKRIAYIQIKFSLPTPDLQNEEAPNLFNRNEPF